MLRRMILSWLGARKYEGINKKISPKDLMYKAAPTNYFWWGNEALKRTKITLDKYGQTEIKKILDLPSGHGRELRFFKIAFPEAEITACEIDKDAVDFCVATFGVKGVYSEKNPSDIKIDESFDLIWCGSLLTHLDADDWKKFLTLFSECLNPKGILIFTIQGSLVCEKVREGSLDLDIWEDTKRQILESYDKNGFGYGDYDGHDKYGIAIVSSEWVKDRIDETDGLKLLEHVEGGWGNLQDSVACIKD